MATSSENVLVPLDALAVLEGEYANMIEQPLEGLRVTLGDAVDFFNWDLVIFGPPDTLYQGGYFKAVIHFPPDYPSSPPTVQFDRATSPFHPNVDEGGYLRIPILDRSENVTYQTQSARTVLLFLLSVFNEPNTGIEPANQNASQLYNSWKDSHGLDKRYEKIVKEMVAASRREAEKDGVVVPTTMEQFEASAAIAANAAETQDIDIMRVFNDDDSDPFAGYDENEGECKACKRPPEGE